MTMWMVKCEMSKVCVTCILRGFFFLFCGRFVICDILQELGRKGKGGRKGTISLSLFGM